MNKKKTEVSSKKKYEELGKIVANVYETGYLDAAKSYRMSFLKGMAQGLGGVIGATLMVALLIWLLSLFSQVPFIGRFVKNAETTINQQK